MIEKEEIPFDQTNIALTIVFLITTIMGYSSIEDGVTSSYLIISGAVFWLVCFIIMSIILTVKINNKTATDIHMGLIRIVPIFGWIYKNSSAYQRMARKLTDDQAIRVCENALEEMRTVSSYLFKREWERFQGWYLKIEVTPETRDKRYTLVENVLCEKIKHEKVKLLEERDVRADRLSAALLLDNTRGMEKTLHKKLSAKASYKIKDLDVAQDTFDAELKKRTAEFVISQRRLHKASGTSEWIFQNLCAIDKEH